MAAVRIKERVTILAKFCLWRCLAVAGLMLLFDHGQANAQTPDIDVGYLSLALSPGYSMIACPFLDATNDLNTIIPTANDGDALYFYASDSDGWNMSVYLGGAWFPDALLLPGSGAFVSPVMSETVVFAGQIPEGTITTHIPAGFSILSMPVPVSMSLTNSSLNMPLEDGDTVYRYDTKSGRFITSTYVSGSFHPVDVVPAVAESFYILKGHAADWQFTYTLH